MRIALDYDRASVCSVHGTSCSPMALCKSHSNVQDNTGTPDGWCDETPGVSMDPMPFPPGSQRRLRKSSSTAPVSQCPSAPVMFVPGSTWHLREEDTQYCGLCGYNLDTPEKRPAKGKCHASFEPYHDDRINTPGKHGTIESGPRLSPVTSKRL
jgi:hypothetical protein